MNSHTLSNCIYLSYEDFSKSRDKEFYFVPEGETVASSNRILLEKKRSPYCNTGYSLVFVAGEFLKAVQV